MTGACWLSESLISDHAAHDYIVLPLTGTLFIPTQLYG